MKYNFRKKMDGIICRRVSSESFEALSVIVYLFFGIFLNLNAFNMQLKLWGFHVA